MSRPATHCRICGVRKTRASFPPSMRGGVCRQCKNVHRRQRRRLDVGYRLRNVRESREFRLRRWAHVLVTTCRRHDPQSNISEADVLALFEKQQGKCYWFGVPLQPSLQARAPQKPSLDRLDASKPHSPENCVLACFAANVGRNSTKMEDWRMFLRTLKKSGKIRT